MKNKVHSDCIPETFRALIIGQSGVGKTSLLMRMLLQPGLLNYNKLYVFAKSLYQPEYQVLKAGLENKLPKLDIIKLMNADNILKKHNSGIEDVAQALADCNENNGIEGSDIECEFYDNSENIPDPKDLDKTMRNVIIFDDVMCDRKQTLAESYYTRGRSANCDAIYLSQNYTHLPLHTIRSNSNFMIFFKSSPRVVEQIHRDFVEVDMSIKNFKQFCNNAWSKKYGFILIDLSRDFGSGDKYRNQLEL
jgi:ASC-1-like (ASCH) protein